MKKTVFLILPVIAILFTACAPSQGLRLATLGSHPSLTDTNAPRSLSDEQDRGINLPISAYTSMNIDVEGILDYVQGGSDFEVEFTANDWLNPWIRFNFSF